MALIQLSDWARSLGKDPVLARQKALRGTVPAVKVGRDWMIEESIPWDARALSVVKVHLPTDSDHLDYTNHILPL